MPAVTPLSRKVDLNSGVPQVVERIAGFNNSGKGEPVRARHVEYTALSEG